MLGCLDALASDFSVYHGIRDIAAMAPGTFLRLAGQIGAYGGAVARAQRAAHEAWASQHSSRPAPRQMVPARPVTPRNAAETLPVASAAELRAMLAKVPGVAMWGEVREVGPGDV